MNKLTLFFTGVNPCKTPAYGTKGCVRAYGASEFQFLQGTLFPRDPPLPHEIFNLRVLWGPDDEDQQIWIAADAKIQQLFFLHFFLH